MSLIAGDIHGNYAKAKAFLEYRPEEEHIFVGDYTDSFKATDEDIVRTMQMIFQSDAVTLAGNHDIQYFNSATNELKCTGFRGDTIFVHVMETYKDKIFASVVRDNFIITHGGVTAGLTHYAPLDDINELNEWLNSEFDKFKNYPMPMSPLSKIFNIASCRGGYHTYGGIFWGDYRYEKFDLNFNQIFGHTSGSQPKTFTEGKKGKEVMRVCVDAPQFYCFNTKTRLIEDFMPDQFRKNPTERDMLEQRF